MKTISFVVPLIALLPTSALPDSSVGPGEIRQFESSLNLINAKSPNTPCDALSTDANSPFCSKLTDDVCDQLWDAKSQGNRTFQTGSVRIGKTGKSAMSATYRMDTEALLESEPRLPADLRKAEAPVLARLRNHLKREEKSKEWLRELGKIKEEWHFTMESVAEKRALAQSPSLKGIQDEDLTLEQIAIYKAKAFELKDEVLRAKYENSSRWKNVQHIFEESKSDILAVIQDLQISPELKTAMIEKVQSVKLSLPFSDPRVLGAQGSCATTDRNAHYDPKFNVLFVCAGSINAYQVSANLYATIAHEIGHSIDPVNFLSMKYNATPVAQTVGLLSTSGAAPIPCDKWKDMVENQFKVPAHVSEPVSPFQTLTDCLVPPKELRPFDTETLTSVTKEMADETINVFASSHAFLWLAQPTLMKNGKPKENEYYLRPDRVEASQNQALPPTWKNTFSAVPGVFVQNLACARAVKNGREVAFADASPEQRNEMFQKAISSTQQIEQAINATRFAICGRECRELVSRRLSRNAQENFADWLSIKALPRFLMRERSLTKRRELAGLAPVDLCSLPGPEQSAPEFAAVEKSYSFESHPDDRIRRLSIFSPEVAQAVGCRLDEETKKGFSSCHF
jgi:hypothetical protein